MQDHHQRQTRTRKAGRSLFTIAMTLLAIACFYLVSASDASAQEGPEEFVSVDLTCEEIPGDGRPIILIDENEPFDPSGEYILIDENEPFGPGGEYIFIGQCMEDTEPPETELTSTPPAVAGTSVEFEFAGTDAGATAAGEPLIFECRVDSADFAPCTTPKTYSDISLGEHTFAVRAIDPSGLIDPTPATYTWTAQCQSGWFQFGADDTECIAAEAGFYVPNAGATEQLPCSAGHYSSASAATACAPAEPGHHVPGDALPEQMECPPGHFNPDSAQSTCRQADIGYYVDAYAATSQTACPIATTTVDTASSNADDCVAIPDTTAPVANVTYSAERNENGWFTTTPLTVTFNWTDEGGSGIDPVNCPPTVVVMSEYDGSVHTSSCADAAGNIGQADIPELVDTNPPVIHLTLVADATTGRALVSFYHGYYDSVIARNKPAFECFLDNEPFTPCSAAERQLGVLPSGQHSFKVRATDEAGWVTEVGDSWIVPLPAPQCNGLDATIVGTEQADTITGTEGDDVIVSLGGADVVDGLGGNDTICLGAGNDRAHGGPDSDTIFGGPGADYIDGGLGNDRIYGEAGANQLIGGDGHDTIYGGPTADRINGGSGNDVIRAGGGSDRVSGGTGWDYLNGQDGNDTIHGGRGRDRIYGAAGNDRLYGGRGNDRIYAGSGDDEVRGSSGNNVLHGGSGNDTISGGTGTNDVNGALGTDTCSQFATSISCEVIAD